MDKFTKMYEFKTNDDVMLKYIDTGAGDEKERLKPGVLLIHGFTGSSRVFSRNIPALSSSYRVITPDLRGHGESGKPKHGYHVARLAMDMRELVLHLDPTGEKPWVGMGGSLGCSVLWCYASLFTTAPFTKMVFIDQSPLQNSTLSDWDSNFCNRGMNNPSAVAALQTTLSLSPETAHKGTIAACLAYRAYPLPTDNISPETHSADESFFLTEAMKGNPTWYGKLMADHTALDWRDSISATFSSPSPKVLVITSSRSGCFPSAGPMHVVDLINNNPSSSSSSTNAKQNQAVGVVVDWGGHWCYWEDPEKFNELVLKWLDDGVCLEGMGVWR